VFTFWSHRLENRLIDESIENKILMRLCCNGVALLRLTRRGKAGRPILQKSPKSPLSLIALRKVDVIVAVALAAALVARHATGPRMFALGGRQVACHWCNGGHFERWPEYIASCMPSSSRQCRD
jgi:hypothetical protein